MRKYRMQELGGCEHPAKDASIVAIAVGRKRMADQLINITYNSSWVTSDDVSSQHEHASTCYVDFAPERTAAGR